MILLAQNTCDRQCKRDKREANRVFRNDRELTPDIRRKIKKAKKAGLLTKKENRAAVKAAKELNKVVKEADNLQNLPDTEGYYREPGLPPLHKDRLSPGVDAKIHKIRYDFIKKKANPAKEQADSVIETIENKRGEKDLLSKIQESFEKDIGFIKKKACNNIHRESIRTIKNVLFSSEGITSDKVKKTIGRTEC